MIYAGYLIFSNALSDQCYFHSVLRVLNAILAIERSYAGWPLEGEQYRSMATFAARNSK